VIAILSEIRNRVRTTTATESDGPNSSAGRKSHGHHDKQEEARRQRYATHARRARHAARAAQRLRRAIPPPRRQHGPPGLRPFHGRNARPTSGRGRCPRRRRPATSTTPPPPDPPAAAAATLPPQQAPPRRPAAAPERHRRGRHGAVPHHDHPAEHRAGLHAQHERRARWRRGRCFDAGPGFPRATYVRFPRPEGRRAAAESEWWRYVAEWGSGVWWAETGGGDR